MTDRAPRTLVREPSVSSATAPRNRLTRQLAAIGGAGGVLSGLLGVGGGVVMVPLLVLRAGYRQRDAHAMSLGAIIPISLASVATYGVAGGGGAGCGGPRAGGAGGGGRGGGRGRPRGQG